MRCLFDKLGLLIAGLILSSITLPFAIYSPSRIAAGQARSLWTVLPDAMGWIVLGCLFSTLFVATLLKQPLVRLLSAILTLTVLILGIGQGSENLLIEGSRYSRVAPGAGFWLCAFALFILISDTIVRLAPSAILKLWFLAGTLGLLSIIFLSGQLDSLSVMAEYRNRATIFWREVYQHLLLAIGSLGGAVLFGCPLGILIHRSPSAKAICLNFLSLVQTIPSMALFGILIAPMGWIAANIPLAHELGIRGIGMAPAFVALFLYSLLPMVANTAAGLDSVGESIREASIGMGMTKGQKLFFVELPLALPILLTGIRIVLVQNIGLTTIAALIGGGGLGVFVFQGLGQTATDLILLGALPTVAMAFISSVILNTIIELTSRSVIPRSA